MDNYSLCFIISHRYYRNHQSYIKYYIDNINNFYSNSLIIIVDNNSKYLDDIKILLSNYTNVLILVNDTECKFEIGAYKVGINYILNNNLLEKYDYYIFTQDNFILKNKYDFNILINNNTKACALNTYTKLKEYYYDPLTLGILNKIHINHMIHHLTLCWCNSFVLFKIKIIDFLDMVKDIVITVRRESECSERYLSGMLFKLNDEIMTSIDGDIEFHNLKYDCWTVNLIEDNIPERSFLKKVQQKNENTADN
jgi:hypothetical protein